MDLKSYLRIDSAELRRFEDVYARYRLMYEAPEMCRPMIIVNVPVDIPTWEERLADPLVMLRAELDLLRPHVEIGDDRVPTVRVQFGTPQVAAAFGCRIVLPENNLPAAGDHVLKRAEDVYQLAMPSLDAGWYGKLAEWTELWKQHIPEGIHIQHPDIQSAFNSAHLIRGNDIFMDFYDHPAEVDALLDRVTDFMIAITKHTKSTISNDPNWFFDWGSLWKGFARISNCSMQMIAPALYRQHVLPRDNRFFKAVGGGRMHYCGITGEVIDEFFKFQAISALDVDYRRHDFFQLCERARPDLALTSSEPLAQGSAELNRLLAGEWPAKRNIVVTAVASSLDAGRQLLQRLRKSIPY